MAHRMMDQGIKEAPARVEGMERKQVGATAAEGQLGRQLLFPMIAGITRHKQAAFWVNKIGMRRSPAADGFTPAPVCLWF